MRHFHIISFCLLLLCFACTNRSNLYYLPEVGLYILETETKENVTLFLSDSAASFDQITSSDIDQIQIEGKEYKHIPYYTFFIPRETKDTLWYKQGAKINSVKMHMEEIPTYQPYIESYKQKLFPLDKYFSLQVYWDGKDYSIHIQNNAGKVVLLQ